MVREKEDQDFLFIYYVIREIAENMKVMVPYLALKEAQEKLVRWFIVGIKEDMFKKDKTVEDLVIKTDKNGRQEAMCVYTQDGHKLPADEPPLEK